MEESSSHNNDFLYQIYSVQNSFHHILGEMLQNIFNLYDFDGDGILDFDDYVGFISDIMYISTLMDRMTSQEYTLDNVLRFARWSSSNFPASLFREPLNRISHEVFLEGIMHAFTERKSMPILGTKLCFSSFIPELLNYFNYYVQIATRRGWPTFIIPEESHNNDDENLSTENIVEPKPTLTHEQQIKEYQERQQQRRQEQLRAKQEEDRIKYQEEQERIRQLEREEIQRRMTYQQQMQMQLQHQLQDNLRNRLREANGHTLTLDQFHEYEPQEKTQELEDYGVVQIKKDELGFEPIEGDVNIIGFINENPQDNIAFKVGERYYLADKTRFVEMITIGLKDNAVFYGCTCEIDGDWTNPKTWALLQHVVIVNPIYINVHRIGLPITYVTLNDIREIINSKHNYYVIVKEENSSYIPSFASDNVLNHGLGSMSALHCQTGQGSIIYHVKKFTPEIIE